MRRAIKNKLSSENGASLVVALLVFLVCITVGSVVLTGATATAGRISRRKELRQERYALESAAGVIKDTLVKKGSTDKKTVNIEYKSELLYNVDPDTKVERVTPDPAKIPELYQNGAKASWNAENPDTVLALINAIAQKVETKLWSTATANHGLKGILASDIDDAGNLKENVTGLKDTGKASNIKSWVSDFTTEKDATTGKYKTDEFVSGDVTIALDGQGDMTQVDAHIWADHNNNIYIQLKVNEAATQDKFKSYGQKLTIKLEASPVQLQLDKQLKDNALEGRVYYSVSWTNMTIGQED